MTRDERLHLNKLSKEIFGKSSAWQKVYNKGEPTKRMSKTKKGEEIEVTYFEHPTITAIKEILEAKAQEMVLQKELKEKNDAAGQQLKLTGTDSGRDERSVADTGDSGPTGSPYEGGNEGSGV